MQTIIAQLAERLVTTLLMTALVLVAVIALIQRRQSGATWTGVWLTLRSVIAAPLHYVRDTLDDLGRRSRAGVPGPRGDQQMMSKRLLFALNLAAVIVGLTIVSAGLVRGWYAMMPPGENVANYKAALSEKTMLDSLIPAHRATLMRLDSVWKADSGKWVRSYADTLKRRGVAANEQKAQIRSQLATRANIARQEYAQRLSQLEANTGGATEDAVQYFRQSVRSLFASAEGLSPELVRQYGLDARDTVLFWRFAAAWSAEREAETTLAEWPSRDVRSKIQGQYFTTEAELNRAMTRDGELNEQLPGLKAGAAWHPFLLATIFASAIVAAFVFLWTSGVLLELIGLIFSLALAALQAFKTVRQPPGVSAPPDGYASPALRGVAVGSSQKEP